MHMVGKGSPILDTFHIIKHDPRYLEVTTKLHLLHQITPAIISIHIHLEQEHFFSLMLSWKIMILNVIITIIDL